MTATLHVQDVKRLETALKTALGPDKGPKALDRTSPLCYPGLRSFKPEEGSLFFGRDESLSEVQNRLGLKRTLVVLGGSGSGKSSLIRAGILPFLNSKRPIPHRKGIWFWAESRPRTAPLKELKDALLRLLDEQAGDKTHDLKKRATDITECFDAPDEEEIADSEKSVPDKDNEAQRRRTRAELLSNRLLRFTQILDEIDIAEKGLYRKASVNLMLLIDQFEEIFRPEVDSEKRQEFLDFLVLTHGRIEEAAKTNPEAGPGLFIVVTMRSEELHRCAEHVPLPELGDVSRSLTDVVNKSFYLVRLLRPKEDQADLTDAILKPVRAVLRAYEFPEPEDQDEGYPYEKGAIGWLLKGAANLTTEHQPDQLPLLQHALRQMWLNAVREWPETFQEGGELPRIRKKHLFPPDSKNRAQAEEKAAKLEECLNVTADNKAGEARQAAFPGQPKEVQKKLGDAALKAMFRALVRRDDRSNWVRRFGTVERMQLFLAHDPDAKSLGTVKALEDAIQKALKIFTSEGFAQKGKTVASEGGEPDEYDISHEALIRNWKTCQDWLRPLETVANALKRAVEDLTPGKQAEAQNNKKSLDWLAPQRVANDLAPLVSTADGEETHFPREWALDEVKPLLSDDPEKGPWSPLFTPQTPDEKKAEIVLDEILKVRREAENERQKVENERKNAEYERQNAEYKRKQKKMMYGALTSLAILILGVLYGLNRAYENGKLAEQRQAAVSAGIIDQANSVYSIKGSPPPFGERALELRYSATLLDPNDNVTDTNKGQPGATELENHLIKLWNGTVELWNRFTALIFGNAPKPPIPEQNDEDISVNKVRPRAVQFWDGIVRTMYGNFLLDGNYVDTKDANTQGKKCITLQSIDDIESKLRPYLSKRKLSGADLKTILAFATQKSDVAKLELKGLDDAYEVRLSYKPPSTTQFEVKRKGDKWDVESQKDARHQLDLRDYNISILPGDQVCLSNDARMMAWVRPFSDVNFVEINWSIRDRQLVPILYSMDTPKANQLPQEKPPCIQGFLSKNLGGAEIQGVLYDRSTDRKNCPATIEQGPEPSEPKIIRSVHFQSLNNFSSFGGDTKDKKPCDKLKDNLGDWHLLTQYGAELHSVYVCENNGFVAIAKPLNASTPSASAAVQYGETKYRPVSVPIGDPEQIDKVFLYKDGHVVLQTKDNLKFMLLVGTHNFKDVLSTVKADPDLPADSAQLSDDIFSEPCSYLPSCKDTVRKGMLSGAGPKAAAPGPAKDQK